MIEVSDIALTPEMFGAVGDGVADDTQAFFDLATAIQAPTRRTGLIIMRSGATYRIGRQKTGAGQFRSPDKPFFVEGVDGLTVLGNGATIKFNDGLYYGSFEADGTPSTVQQTNQRYAAEIGSMLDFKNCDQLRVENLTLDGNQDNYVLGGGFGDTGIQSRAIGLRVYYSSQVVISNVSARQFGMDGFYVWVRGTAKPGPTSDGVTWDGVVLENCQSDFSGRTGLTLGGGKGFIVRNCRFGNTGQGRVSSATYSGVDIESPVGYNSYIRFENCSFLNNRGPGLTCGSGSYGELTVSGCEFWQGFAGTGLQGQRGSGDGLYLTTSSDPGGTKVRVVDCRFHSCTVKFPNNVIWTRCTFDDEAHPAYGVSAQNRSYLCSTMGGRFDHCTFSVARSDQKLVSDASGNDCRFTNCRFLYAGTGAEQSSIARFGTDSEFLIANEFAIGAASGTGYYVDADPNVRIDGSLTISAKLAWGSRSGTAGPATLAATGLLQKRLYLTGAGTVRNQQYYATSAPTSGSFGKGDIVWNLNVAAGGTVGWVCVAAPSTWKTFGTVSA